MPRRTTPLLVATLALLSAGCAHQPLLTAPSPPPAAAIQEIRIRSLPPADALARTVTDRQKIDSVAASGVLAKEHWTPAGRRELLPLYRIELVSQAGSGTVFWLGVNSHPPRFPCFAICSGWWIAPSTAAGEIDPSRYKGMTSAVSSYLLRDLGF